MKNDPFLADLTLKAKQHIQLNITVVYELSKVLHSNNSIETGIPVLHDSMGGNRWDCFSIGKRVGKLYGSLSI